MPTLHLTVFWCADADPGLFRTPAIFGACRAIAGKYNLTLETMPQGVRDAGFVLNFNGPIIGRREWTLGLQEMTDVANSRVRGLADQAFQGANRLPIIFGSLDSGTSELYIGQTIRSFDNGRTRARSDWLPWCIVDPVKAYDRPHTLLHEIGHAAGAEHNLGISAGPGELMTDGDISPPITIAPDVVGLLTKSYFCW